MYTPIRRNGFNSYSRPYKRGRWGSTYGKAVGSSKAAKTGNKISYYNAQVSGYISFDLASGSFTSNIQTFHPYTCHATMTGSGSSAKYALTEEQYRHGGAVWDKGFRLMCAMNDECRLCRMNVKLQPATTLPNNVAVRLASIVDRNMTYEEWQNLYTGAVMDDAFDASSVLENQGVVMQTFNGNRVAPLNRYSVPTDLKEKTSWVDCSIEYYKTANFSPLADMMLHGWYKGETTYAPAFTYCLQTSIAAAADISIVFGYTVEYSFAFRNPKSGLDFFIKQEQVGYVNPASRSLPAKAATTTKTTQPETTTETVEEEEEDHDPGTS